MTLNTDNCTMTLEDGYVMRIETHRDPLDWLIDNYEHDGRSTPLATDCDTPESLVAEEADDPRPEKSDSNSRESGEAAIPVAAPRAGV